MKFHDWEKSGESIYIKQSCTHSRYDIFLNYKANGHGWVPQFADEQMYECYQKHNPGYYIQGDEFSAMAYMDNFLVRFSKLLIFS